MSEPVFEKDDNSSVDSVESAVDKGVINILFSREKHPEAVEDIKKLLVLYIEKGKPIKRGTTPTMKEIFIDSLSFYRKAMERGIEIE